MPPQLGSLQDENPPSRRILYLAGGEAAPVSQDAMIFSLPFAQLCPAELARIAPDLVVFPLFSATLDAIVVLTRLNELGYAGRCLVLAPRLPKPHLIEAELRASQGAMQVQLLTSDAPLE
ncbi:MAG: hypothetical protein V4586_12860 [Pseudomonadota bacterium]